MIDDNIKIDIDSIKGLDIDYYDRAIKREECLIKPPHSLGILEDIACKVCAIKRDDKPILSKKRLIVFASDNGVYEEKVSSCPQHITIDQTINLTRGITGASSMSTFFKDDIEVYDVGVNGDIDTYIKEYNDRYHLDIKNNVIDKKISYGTKNICKESAMTDDQLIKAIDIGIEAIKKAKDNGIDILGVGEMGICNTTTSSAVLSLLSGKDAKDITGRGAGLTDDDYMHKIDMIQKSIDRAYDDDTKKDIVDNPERYVYDIVKEVGGYDIASMIGAYIGAAYYHIPIVVDGYIGIVAALCAVSLNKYIKDYIFLSHISMEKGYKIAKDMIGLRPMFDLDMRLGEGSGCVIAFRIIDSALAMHNGMKTFSDANIDDSYLDSIR